MLRLNYDVWGKVCDRQTDKLTDRQPKEGDIINKLIGGKKLLTFHKQFIDDPMVKDFKFFIDPHAQCERFKTKLAPKP